MLVVYIAHPIGGNVAANMSEVERITGVLFAERPEIYPIAPYLVALRFLNDADPGERVRGMKLNELYFRKRFIDEVWLFGDRVSSGMWQEVCWARALGIPVVPTNSQVQLDLIRKEYKIGDRMVVFTNPGQRSVVEYLGEHEHGINVRNECHPYLDLDWADIIHLAPAGAVIPFVYASN